MIPVRAIDHVVLRVHDLERMIAFYREALGCELVWRRPELGLVHLRAGSGFIDLVTLDGAVGRRGGAGPGREGHNMDHLCLRVEPFDVEAIRARLVAHGAAPGAVESRFGAEGEGPSIYVEDPEGNTVELKGPALAWPEAARRPA